MSNDKKPVVKPVRAKAKPAPMDAAVAPVVAEVEVVAPAPAKVETPKVEVLKVEAAPAPVKVEAPKVEAVAPTPATVEAPKAVAPKAVTTKSEASKATPKASVGAAPMLDVMKPFALMQEQFRAQTEKGAEQARANYATMKGNAETATAKLEESLVAARTGAKALGDKVIEAVQAQAQASIDHAHKLGTVKTIEEAAKLQHAFLLAQMDAFKARTVDFAAFSQKIANDISEPAKASFAATWNR